MSANRDNKKKGKRGQFKGKDKRGGERRTRVPQGKRTTVGVIVSRICVF